MPKESRPSPFERKIAQLVTNPMSAREIARVAHRLACDRIPPIPTGDEIGMADELTQYWLQGWTVGLQVVRAENRQVFLRIDDDIE